MKNILFSALLALGLLSLTGCYDTAPTTDAAAKTTKSKCGDGKCGEGKCGEGKAEKADTKCGAGKCGDGK